MTENLLQYLLVIFALLTFGMGLTSWLIYASFKTPLTKAILSFWLFQVASFTIQAFNANTPADSLFAALPLYFLPLCTYILFQIMKVFNPVMKVSKVYIWLLVFGYLLTTVLIFFRVSFTLKTLPGVFFLGVLGLHLCYQFSKNRKLSSLERVFVICTVIWVVHTTDYPFLRYYKDAALFGFTLYIIIIIGFAQILMSMGLKRLSDEKHLELQNLVEERTEQLISQSRLSALGEMAGGIAHEINNPLNIIVGRGELLRRKHTRKKLSEEDLLNGLDIIEKMAFRITKIIKALKDFSRQSIEVPFAETSMQEVLDQILPFCTERFDGGGVRLEIKGQMKDTFHCKSLLLSQVFLNLLNNAYDAVNNSEEKWVQIEVFNMGEKIKVLVSDSGPGVPLELSQKIMQPFFTTKDIGKGTGLGLSISTGIIDQHNGRIFLDTQYKFTTFVVELPISQPDKA